MDILRQTHEINSISEILISNKNSFVKSAISIDVQPKVDAFKYNKLRFNANTIHLLICDSSIIVKND